MFQKKFSKRFQKFQALFLTLVMMGSLLPTHSVLAVAAEDSVIYENDFESDGSAAVIGGNKALEFDVAGDVANSWVEVFKKELYFEYAEQIYEGAKLNFDLLLPTGSTYSGLLKTQAVTKMGESWAWTQATTIPELSVSNFVDTGDGYLKASVSIPFGSEITTVQGLKAVIPCLAASNCSYIGKIYLDNVKLINGIPVVAAIYENDFEADTEALTIGGNKALEFAVAGDVANSWVTVFQKELNYEYADEIYSGAKLNFDLILPTTTGAAYTGVLKAQAVTKMGTGWAWTQATTIPEISYNDFVDTGSGYLKATVSIPFSDEIEVEQGLKAIIPCLAASNCSYVGKIYLDNVKLINGEGTQVEPNLPEVEPLTFEFANGSDINLWSNGGNYQYSGGMTIGYDSALSAMKLDVDYTNDAALTWSEAKVKYTFDQSKELAGYNLFSFDFIYDPTKMTKGSFQAKLSAGIIDTNIAIGSGSDYGSGLKKATVVLNLAGAANSIGDFTIGLVGNSTDYKGTICIDNVSFSQAVVEDIYVNATLNIEAQTPVQVASNAIVANGQTQETSSSITLVDENAKDYTAQLYAYLEAVGKTDSVLFGHQNDTTHKSGNAALSNSDTKDITGSISAVMGMDTLSLTGNELSTAVWDAPLAERVAACEAATKEAANQGAIITLSAHMPNFAVIDQRVKNSQAGTAVSTDSTSVGILSDGHYNFSGYTPGTLTGDIVKRIMPGQDLNYLFTDYLDMIAAYGKALEDDNISILFRPFHEGTGSWFWWGKAFCDTEASKNLYKYTVEYLRDVKEVHNFIYVYGPSGDAESTAEYALRYPGDDYVDMVGFDMYHQVPTIGDAFIDQFKTELSIVQQFATEHHKLFAVTETGVANANNQALLKSENARLDWYNEVLDAVAPSNASYFLTWANFGENTSIYTPYLVSKTATVMKGHEMLDNFIDFFNDSRTVFASQVGDFEAISVATNANDDVTGYITAPTSGSRVLNAATLTASITNEETTSVVKFVAKDKTGSIVQEITAIKNENGKYSGALTADKLAVLGATPGTLSLVVDGDVYNTINVKYNMPEPVLDPTVVDTFENYYGESAILNTNWSTGKGSGCTIVPSLTNKKYQGDYGVEFKYSIITGGYVGITKSMNGANWSSKNALQLWTIPDGKKQKVVVQVTCGGNTFEVYLNQYNAYNDAKGAVLVTIPFSSFVGRDNPAAVFDASSIQSIGLWCNTIVPTGENSDTFKLDSNLYYDDIKAVTSDAQAITITSVEVNSSNSSSSNSSTTEPVVEQPSNTTKTTQEGGKTVTTITMNEVMLNQKLNSQGGNAIIAVPVNAKADVVVGELSGQMIKSMETKQAVLEMKTENASYTLPAKQINIDDLSKQLGKDVALKDIKVRIQISKSTDEVVKVVENSAKNGEFTIVAPPVEFKVECVYGDKKVEVSTFNAFVERTIAIPDGVDPSKVTTAIVVDANGTVRQVPTKIVVIDGKNYAKINSLTNSTYSLIYHPVQFKDVETHWAKDSINDMGSRMIIKGKGNNLFAPDEDMTRAEFAAIIVATLGLKSGVGNNSFTDVSASDWYCDYVKTAVEYKLIDGYGNGKFGPMDLITREEAMTIIAKAMKVTGLNAKLENGEAEKLIALFGDSSQTAVWAKNSVADCLKAGIFVGNKEMLLNPKGKITRGEVAVIVRRLLQKSNLI